ncbi:MAG: hypothetical protein JKY19_02560 [Alcanivoracaceae bacterium]|nr:hypothetical protein [Alcanivoracaceae bacterium]
MKQLPVTQNGKIDSAALSKMAKPLQQQEYVAATNKSEHIMLEVLSSELHLDIKTISMSANFFDIGGHSLSLLNIVQKLNDNGVQSSIKQFYEYETLKEICSASSGAENYSENDSLLKLNTSTKGTPLYLVHPMGGRADCYKQLAKHLENIAPVFGIQAPFVANRDFSFTSLFELAEYYAHAILMKQPEGPYRLGGWSVGGLLAQKIVHVLNQAGKEVEYFVGLDSFMIMPYQQQSSDFEALKKVVATVRKEKDIGESFFPRGIENKSLKQQIDITIKLLKLDDSETSKQQLIQSFTFGINFFKAKISLSPQNISKKSILFIAKNNTNKQLIKDGWKKAICSAINDYKYVEARHLHILEGESFIQIADKILSDLNNIDLINKRA